MSRRARVALICGALALGGYGYWKVAVPEHRADIRSELVTLGDLDGDRRWTAGDLGSLDSLMRQPFEAPAERARRLDLNRNGLVDEEDVAILRALVGAQGDPYAAEEAARAKGTPFPRPRELYRYEEVDAYRPRPTWALPYPPAGSSALAWFELLPRTASPGTYGQSLDSAIYQEAVRFDLAYRRRLHGLLPVERDYAARKLARAEALFQAGERFELLLALTELVEDAETLTARARPDLPLRLLAFRDHLRELLSSPLYAEFAAGRKGWRLVLEAVSDRLQGDLGLAYDLERLGPARNLTSLENYLQRGEWQYYKSSAREADLRALVGYAQQDPRYQRAVSRTSRRHQDPGVENHNLPMVLLYREALRIEGGDRKRAVGLLDEAIRIPYAWIKAIPREALPHSLALENFLLPGNMEDGADKSRHWNVFGGICLYKSPQEALDLALKREAQDLREAGYSETAMREFLRDMIANLNGMYHVMAVDPGLLGPQP